MALQVISPSNWKKQSKMCFAQTPWKYNNNEWQWHLSSDVYKQESKSH